MDDIRFEESTALIFYAIFDPSLGAKLDNIFLSLTPSDFENELDKHIYSTARNTYIKHNQFTLQLLLNDNKNFNVNQINEFMNGTHVETLVKYQLDSAVNRLKLNRLKKKKIDFANNG